MPAICGKCIHFSCDYPEDWDEEDRLGECIAIDIETLPHAWRWCPRERSGVYANEESACPKYKERV